MADVFISYKREERPQAERLSIVLEQLGFEVWWDFDLLSGESYRTVIKAVIDQCKAAVVLWSKRSVQSSFVMDEAEYARQQGKLCPVRLDDVDLPFGFGGMHTGDLSQWDGEIFHPDFQAVVRAIEARTGKKGRLGAAGLSSQQAQAAAAELESFKAAQLAGNPSALRAFLARHPQGAFTGFVKSQLDSMDAEARLAERVGAGGETVTAPARPKARASRAKRATADGLAGVATPPPATEPPPVQVAPVQAPPIQPASAQTPPTPPPPFQPSPPGPPTPARWFLVAGVVAAALVVLGGGGLWLKMKQDDVVRARAAEAAAKAHDLKMDDSAFSIAKAANTPAAYDAYLANYPSGAHAADARQMKDQLNQAGAGGANTQAAGDDAAFQAAQAANTYDAYSAYLTTFPSGAHVADAQTARAAVEPYRVHVCNKSSRNVAFAGVFQPVGEASNWTHKGWWRVAPGACAYIFDTGNPAFALRAESLDDSTTWSGTDLQVCFMNPGPFEFSIPNGGTCPAGAVNKTAHTATATNRGEFTWSIEN